MTADAKGFEGADGEGGGGVLVASQDEVAADFVHVGGGELLPGAADAVEVGILVCDGRFDKVTGKEVGAGFTLGGGDAGGIEVGVLEQAGELLGDGTCAVGGRERADGGGDGVDGAVVKGDVGGVGRWAGGSAGRTKAGVGSGVETEAAGAAGAGDGPWGRRLSVERGDKQAGGEEQALGARGEHGGILRGSRVGVG